MLLNYIKRTLFIAIAMILSHSFVIAQNTIEIGSGTVQVGYPFYTYYMDSKTQMIYTSSEISTAGGGAGNITDIAFNVTSNASQLMNGFSIQMQNTTQSTLTSFVQTGWTTVYSTSTSITSTGWFNFHLSTPFTWNGTSNLLIQICFDNTNYTSNTNIYGSSVSSLTWHRHNDNSAGCSFTGGSGVNTRPNIKMTMASLSPNDMAVVDWIYPTSGTTASQYTPVILKIKNFGTATQSNIPVKYSIDNGNTWATTTYSNSITSGNTANVSFGSAMADMSNSGVYRCIGVVSNTGDTINYNDTLRRDITICGGSYSGTYTIGSDTADDFPSIQSAISSIETCGISGPVTFKIKSGVYNEQFHLRPISGASSSTPITFESYTGNPNDVVFSYSATSSADNYVLGLDTSSYITIKNMTFRALGSTYANAARIVSSTNCTLDGNIFKSVETTSYNSEITCINLINSSSSTTNNNITIKNNTLLNGSYSIYNYSNSSYQSQNITIENNDISNFNNYAIYFYYLNGSVIKSNKIYAPSSASAYGIYITNSTNISEISKNKINLESGTCLFLYYTDGTSSQPIKVSNNFFTESNIAYTVVYLYNSNYINFDFNSINALGSSSSYACLSLINGNNLNIRNNNIINSNGGLALNNNSSTNINTIDYNNYYTSGSYIAAWSNNSLTTLSALQSASGKDSHSMSNNITFYSDENLHVSGSSLNNMGTPVSGITEDIDGQTRNTTTPDIGADEFSIYPNDGGLISMQGASGACPGSAQNIVVSLKNFGSSALTNVTFGMKINGSNASTLNWTGLLGALNTTNATVGSYNFSSDTIYNIKIYIKTVNGGIDSNSYNDTLEISNYHTSLASGTYIIGSSSSAQFIDVASAISALEQYGICGSVVFKIENGTYNGNYTLSNSITGLSSSNTITFESQSGDSADVVLENNNSGYNNAYVFDITGASYITFKNLSFKSTSSYYPRAIKIENSCHHILIDGCLFNAVQSTNYAANYYSNISIDNSNHITIQNSTLLNGGYGIYSYGSSGSDNTDIKIKDNLIKDFYTSGIFAYYTGDSLTINGNTILDRSSTYNCSGVYLSQGNGFVAIKNNIIKLNSNNVSSGISLSNQNYTNSSTVGNKIYNNYINIENSTNSFNGIYSYSNKYVDIYYNTIKSSSTNSNPYALYSYYTNYINIKNNNFDMGGTKIYYIRYGSLSSSDYNNFNTTNTSAMYYNGYTRSVASHISSSGVDSHSKNVAPSYVSSNDFHLYDNTLNNAGTPISGITTDIDGDARNSSTPDIGADEFDMLSLDMELYAINKPNDIAPVGSNEIRVAIRNMGTSYVVIDSLHYQIDNGSVNSVGWSGYLAPLDIDSLILIGTETLTAGTHSLKVWSNKPNNSTDLNHSNDTLSKTITVQVMPSISVTPSILSATINTCNDSVTVPLVIKNVGGSTLTGTISGATGGGNGTPLEVVLLTYGSSSSYYGNLVNALDQTFTNYNLSYSSASSSSQLQSDLNGKDVVILPYMTTTSYISTYQSFASTLQSFVNAGGNMIFTGQYNNYYQYVTNTGLFNNTSYSGYNNSSTITVANHPINNNVTSSLLSNVSDYFFYFSGTPANYTPLLTYGSYNVAGISSYGNGQVIYLGFRYYNSNQTVIETFVSNTLKYIYEGGTNWLHNSDSSFSIAPGDSSIFNYVMDGTGLGNGTYTANIEINSNDIGNPTVIVPCTMVVAGPPSISTSTNSIGFSSAYVNIPSYDTIDVYNSGCGDLIISNITATNSAFSSTYHTDTIVPGDTGIIVYKFLTANAGAYAATSTIYSNTSNYVISLAANATNPPAITVSPSPMNVTITNCNDSVTANLQIQNTGGGTLTATVEKTKDSVEIIILTYGQYTSYTNNMIASLGETFTKYNYTTLNTTSGTTLQNQINSQNADVIIIPYINGSSYANSYSNLASTLQSFTNNGGTVIFTGQYYDAIFSATGLISGSRIGSQDYSTLYTQNTSDPITLGFASSYYSSTDDFNYYTFSGSNVTSLVKYGTYDMAVKKQYGAGLVVVIGHYYNDITQTNTKAILSNTIKLASEQGADWVQFTTSTANLSTGSSALKAIQFNANGLATGTYTSSIKITSNSPSSPITFVPCTLTVQNQMTNGVNLGPDTTHCGAITLNAGSYGSYLWNTGNTTQTISAVSTGTYSVTVTNGGNCNSSDQIAVTINPVPSVSLTGLPSSGCTNGTAISLNASPSGGVFAGPGVSSNSFNPATAGLGTHTIFYSYTNAYNCTNSASQNITVYAPPSVSFTGLNSSYCPQGTASILTGSPSGGIFTGNGMVQNTFVPSVAGIGTHPITYSYTDVHNCSNTDTHTTTINASSITIGISSYQNDYCIDGQLDTLTATPAGGTFYGDGMAANVFDPAAAGTGTHYIKYSKLDPNSCLIIDSVEVTVHALPTGLSISGLFQQFCANDAAVTISGYPAGGVFSGLGISGNSFNPSVAGAGNHNITYTYTDNFGCSNTAIQPAVVNAIPVITFTNLQNQYCENDAAISIVASPVGGTISGNELSGNSFDPSYAGSGSFWVYYEYTNSNSCYNKDSFNIVVNTVPNVSIGTLPSSLCSNGNPITLTGSPMGGIFVGNGVTGNQFNPSQSSVGTNFISYTYIDNNGCSDIDSASTNITDVHSVFVGNDTTINYNTSTQLSGLVVGGSGSFSFAWAPANMVTNATQLSPNTVNLTNSTQFTLTVNDNSNNCVNSDDILVNISGGILTGTISANPNTICDGESTQLLALGSGGSSSYTYQWSSNPSGFSSTVANPIFNPSVSTTFTCIIDDGTDTIHKHIYVSVNPSPQVSLLNLNAQYCNNEAVVSLQVSPPNGSLVGSGISGLTFDPAVASIGANTVIYSYTNSFGCYGADTQIVIVSSSPSAYAGEDTLLPCLNGGVALGQQPINGVSYLWSPAIGLSNNQIANPTSTPNLSLNYVLQATNTSNNCSAFDTVHILVTGAPTAHASNDTLVCANSPVILTASGGDTYFWSNGALGDTITVSPSTSTLYYVIVSQAGCSDLDTVFVNISKPMPNLGPDTTICSDASITLDAGAGFVSYMWSNNATSQTISVDSNGIGFNTATYIVEVYDNLNCNNSDTINVTFENCNSINNINTDLFVMSIYPNPSKGQFTIESNNTEIRQLDMTIMNSTGKLIKRKSITNNSGIFKENIDLSTYPKGIYFIKLSNGNDEKSIKVVIQ